VGAYLVAVKSAMGHRSTSGPRLIIRISHAQYFCGQTLRIIVTPALFRSQALFVSKSHQIIENKLCMSERCRHLVSCGLSQTLQPSLLAMRAMHRAGGDLNVWPSFSSTATPLAYSAG